MKKILLSCLVLSINFTLKAQINAAWCGSDHHLQQHLEANPNNKENWDMQLEQLRQKQEYFEQLGNNTGEALRIVPVVVHIIHDNWSGNITDEQVEDALRVMTEDFKRLNTDTTDTRSLFKPFAANCELEFRLAKIDPNGNCTKGIVRVNSVLTNSAYENVKALSYWNSSKYFNIWVVKTIANFTGGNGTILGYAQFPGQGSWNTYGVVCRNDQFGTIGTAAGADGRTMSHEAGHCFGLLHTFQGGCGSNCSTSGDYICDTPPAYDATYGCSLVQNTCTNDASGPSAYNTNVVDQIENYMSYDACQNMFSLGQKSRINAAIAQYSQLTSLVSNSNNIATGTNNGYVVQTCKPIADFKQSLNMICTGGSVIFSDMSYNAPIVSRSWTFTAGNPASSTDSTKSVSYSTVGKHNVSLTATNGVGNSTKTVTGAVIVSSTTASYSGWGYQEGFENAGTFTNDWIVVDPSGSRKWERITTTGYNSSSSIRILNLTGNGEGEWDEIISPSFNISQVPNPELKFKVAYAQKNSSSNDNLRVYYSTNCGQSWVLKYTKSGSQFSSVSPTATNFVPSSPSQWKEEIVSLNNITGNSNIRIKFYFKNGVGNNIYIDDINIGGANSINESLLENNTLHIYPNPASTGATISFNLLKDANFVQLQIVDVIGKVVGTVFNGTSLNQGKHTVEINDFSNFTSGVYFIKLETDGQVFTQKLIIE
jgi:PKD repeat protein